MDGKSNHELSQLALYEVHPEAIPQAFEAISEFVEYIKINEPGVLRYEVWQEREHPARFVHLFILRDAKADQTHRNRQRSKNSLGFSTHSAWSRLILLITSR